MLYLQVIAKKVSEISPFLQRLLTKKVQEPYRFSSKETSNLHCCKNVSMKHFTRLTKK